MQAGKEYFSFSNNSLEIFQMKTLGISFGLSQVAVCVPPKRFNRVSGLARRPIAHTCAFTLEISTDYTNYMQFSTEMKAVLSDESSWFMDAL